MYNQEIAEELMFSVGSWDICKNKYWNKEKRKGGEEHFLRRCCMIRRLNCSLTSEEINGNQAELRPYKCFEFCGLIWVYL